MNMPAEPDNRNDGKPFVRVTAYHGAAVIWVKEQDVLDGKIANAFRRWGKYVEDIMTQSDYEPTSIKVEYHLGDKHEN